MPGSKRKGRSKKSETRRKLCQFADQINSAWLRRAEDLLTMGILLNEASALERPEGFKQWVKDDLPFSHSSARNYMNIAKIFKSPDDVKPFSVRSLILMSKREFPADLRSGIIESAKEGNEWTTKRIQQEWEALSEDSDQGESTSESKKGSRKNQMECAKATSTSQQATKKVNETKAAFDQLIEAAEHTADIIGRKKTLTTKSKTNCRKRIKKVQSLLRSILEEIAEK